MIDGHPKRADHRGGNIIDNSMEDAVPSTFKGMETMWNGVRVVLDRPSHVVRPQDLTRIGVAVNTALARNTYVADKKTTCFCKMLVQIRCACTNPEKAAMDRLREEKEKKMSVKCWAYVAAESVGRGGSAATATLQKPTDRSGRRRKNFNKGEPDVRVSFR